MPDMLLEEGLSEAIHYFCQSLQQSTGIEIELQLCPLPRINKEYELMLYRIIQELLQNAVKHSRANHILVQLNYRENLLSILVEDNGVGFDTRLLQQYKNGMGINSIRTRVHSLDGHMDINSKEGVGTTVYIEFDIHSLQQKSTEQYADNSSYNR
jgi:signal transduction histidine kinase